MADIAGIDAVNEALLRIENKQKEHGFLLEDIGEFLQGDRGADVEGAAVALFDIVWDFWTYCRGW